MRETKELATEQYGSFLTRLGTGGGGVELSGQGCGHADEDLVPLTPDPVACDGRATFGAKDAGSGGSSVGGSSVSSRPSFAGAGLAETAQLRRSEKDLLRAINDSVRQPVSIPRPLGDRFASLAWY